MIEDYRKLFGFSTQRKELNKMKMTISEALIAKNRLIEKFNKYMNDIQQFNSCRMVDGKTNRPIDINPDNMMYYINDIVNIKTALHKATDPIRDKIFRLSELKSLINQIQSIDTTNGVHILDNCASTMRYSDQSSEPVKIHYHAIILEQTKRNMIEQLSNDIDKIQNEINVFNYHHNIEVELTV